MSTVPTSDLWAIHALATKVHGVLHDEGDGVSVGCGSEPLTDVIERYKPATEREDNIMDWAYVFGIAYGIARGEDPYEPDDACAARAKEAAAGVMVSMGGHISPKVYIDPTVPA